MRNIIRFIHSVFAAIMILLYTFLGAFFVIAGVLFIKNDNYYEWLQKLWNKLLVLTFGIKLTVEGLENIEKDKKYVIVANHSSLIDIPVTVTCLPLKLRMLAKKELFKIPVFGWAMSIIGHISIDRDNKEKAIKSITDTIERLKTDTITPMLYPEGTRSLDGHIGKFKKGGFVLAIDSQRDILPVIIIGTANILPKSSIFLCPGPVHIIVEKPVPTLGKVTKDRTQIANQIRDIMVERFEKYKKENNFK